MPAFAVLEPTGYQDTAARADGFIFLHEKFNLAAFLLGPLWMMWRRLWLELPVYLAVVAVVGYGLYALGVGWPAVIPALALIQLFLGLEATTLVRGMRVRHGWRDGGVVIADDLELAERRFFDDRAVRRSAARAPAAPASGFRPPANPGPLTAAAPGPSQPGVIGLFPEPGGGQ
jgi:Protein of unknown function (DUF2628)